MARNPRRQRSRLIERARRPYDALTEKLAEVVRQSEITESKVEALRTEVTTAYTVPPADRRGLADLSAPMAEFLTWAHGPNGYAAQAKVWFNPMVDVLYSPGKVSVYGVSERIVETPWVFATIVGNVPAGGRVLDLGGGESTVGLSLASLGYEVTVVDPRGVGIPHPNLTEAACRADELDDSHRDFDAVIALSSVEHFGLGAYDGDTEAERADIAALASARERCTPGATLALTVPFGAASVSEFQRVYDEPGVRELATGWDETDFRVAALEGSEGRMVTRPEEWVAFQRDVLDGRTIWSPCAPDDVGDRRAVAMFAGVLSAG